MATNTPFLIDVLATPGGTTVSGTINFGSGGPDKDDLLVVVCATANQSVTAPSGYTQINSFAGLGTAGTAGAVGVSAFYKFSDGTETSVVIADPGNHLVYSILVFRGVDPSSPINASATSTLTPASTAVSAPSVTTTLDACLIVNVVASDIDATGSRHSSWTNAALSTVTERIDGGSASGTGSGLGVATGIKTTAGSTGSTTVTLSTASVQAMLTFALKPRVNPTNTTKVGSFTLGSSAQRLLGPTDDIFYSTYQLTLKDQYDTTPQTSNLPEEVVFSADGVYFYALTAFSEIYQYQMTSPWDISTASYTTKMKDITTLAATGCTTISFSPDGLKLFYNVGTSYRYAALGTAWDISTLVLTAVETVTNGQAPTQVVWKPDGLQYFLHGQSGVYYKYTVTTPWTFAGRTLTSNGATGLTGTGGIAFSSDGKKVVVTDGGLDTAIEYACATPWVLTDKVDTGFRYYYGDISIVAVSIAWNDTGEIFYICGAEGVIAYSIYTKKLSASTGSFILTGKDAALKLNRNLPISVYAGALSGQAAGLAQGHKLIADTGSFALTGQNATLLFTPAGYPMTAGTGSFVMTGQAAGLAPARKLVANTQSYALTGINNILKTGYKLPAGTGAFVLTGNDVVFSSIRGITADAMNLVLTGNPAGLGAIRKLPVSVVTFTQTRIAASLTRQYKLPAGTGSFTMTFKPGGTHFYLPAKTFDLDFKAPTFAGERAGPRIKAPVKVFDLNFRTPTLTKGVNINAPTLEFTVSYGASLYKAEIIESCSGELIPLSHMQDSKKLEADAIIDLFEILLGGSNTRIFLKMNKTVEWQGNIYEGTGIKIEGVGTYADDQVSRPKLTIRNPEGIFSALVDSGALDNAKVYRIRLLKAHLDDDIPVYRRQQWRVTRIAGLNNKYIALELRDMLDGQNFLTPGRMFIPPDFPSVSLT